MRRSFLALALLAGTALPLLPATPAPAGSPAPASDLLDQAACLARSTGAADVRLAGHAGADRYDLGWMGDPDLVGRRPYVVHIGDRESPRSLIAHDRLVLPGLPADWVVAARGSDLVLCGRRAKAVVVIERQFCSGPVSAGAVVNGEIEEITFLAGVSWLADDLAGQIDGTSIPAELAEDLRGEVAMASPMGRIRDPDAPQVIAYAPKVASLVARWRVVPMSHALGDRAAAAATCFARHADLRDRIMSAKRWNR